MAELRDEAAERERARAQLNACIALLDHVSAPVRESLRLGGQEKDPQAIMLTRGLAFACDCMAAMIAIVELDSSAWVCLPTVCRPLLELSTKLLWANREKDGWIRLQVDAAREELDYAENLQKLKGYEDIGKRKALQMQGVIDQYGPNGIKNLPDMRCLLEMNHRKDVSLKHRDTADFASFEYANFYQLMCGPAHGHVASIVKDSRTHLRVAVMGAIRSVFELLRAALTVCCANETEPCELMEEIGTRINSIAKGECELRLDELRLEVSERD